MRLAKTIYVSPYQTDLHPLRELLEVCEPYGLQLERSDRLAKNYRVIRNGQSMTDFMTLAKLSTWMDGFKNGVEFYKNKNEFNKIEEL